MQAEDETPEPEVESTTGLKVLGKIDLQEFKKPAKKSKTGTKKDKKPAAKSQKETPSAPEGSAKEKEEKPEADKTAAEITTTPTPVADPTTDAPAQETPAVEEKEKAPEQQSNFLKTEVRKLEGPTILGSIKLPEPRKPEPKKPVASSSDDSLKAKKRNGNVLKSMKNQLREPLRLQVTRHIMPIKDVSPVIAKAHVRMPKK
ncbi:hypothetical protein MASR1M74_06210 [Lentimicrobium sp.]